MEWIGRTLEIRTRYAGLIADPDPTTFILLESTDPMVWAVVRRRGDEGLALVVNLDVHRARGFSLHLPTGRSAATDLLSGTRWALEGGRLEAEWPPAGCALLEIEGI